MRAGGGGYLEGAHQGVVHAHHGPRIVELPTVIGGTKGEGDRMLGPGSELS